MHHRKGTIRNELSSINLLQNKFTIDEHQFWDILGYIASFLEKINYYNTENEPDGNWKALIEDDPVIYLVSIINTPLQRLKDLNGKSEYKLASSDDKIETVKMLLEYFRKVNKWFKVLDDMGETRLANKIGNVLNDLLSYEKDQLQAFLRNNEVVKPSGSGLLTSPVPPNYDKDKDAAGKELNLVKSVNIFFKGIFHIQDAAKDYLINTVQKRRKHAAHTSLYIVFTLLLKSLTQKTNLHSKNHLDFYYRQVLQQKLFQGRDSEAIVCFKLLPGISNYLVEPGTLLSAGKVNNSIDELTFEVQKPLLVQALQLTELQTLFFNKNPYIRFGAKDPLISSVNHKEFIKNGKNCKGTDGFNYLFGADEKTALHTQIDAKTVAAMGFVVCSSVLDLDEGQRTVDLHIKINSASAETSLYKLLNEIKSSRNQETDTVFSEIFENAFKIAYSSKKGWISFEKYEIELSESTNEISFSLFIPASSPPVELLALNEQNLSWPALKFELNEYAPFYAYSFLKGLDVEIIDIDVTVKGIKNLSVYNNIGKIALGKTFDLFGPLPALGSYLLIGKSELFSKTISSVDVILEWDSLPLAYGGFETYYANYSENIDNDSFMVAFDILSNGHWLPYEDKEKQVRSLYETEPCLDNKGHQNVRLKSQSVLSYTGLDELGIEMVDIKDPILYNVNTNSGFLRLKLNSPPFAFGQELYQEEFRAIVTYNAKNNTDLPYPNKPYVPKVNRLEMSYKASDTLSSKESNIHSGSRNEHRHAFHHITPFGWNTAPLKETDDRWRLVPNYEGEGYLFFNLKGANNAGLVSIYFDLQTSANQSNLKENKINFEYRYFGIWKQLPQKNLMTDNTNGFIKSGIIDLMLPEISDENEEVVYEFRIYVTDNAVHYPLLKGIYLNATEVVSNAVSPDLKGVNIEAGKITKLLKKTPAIQEVMQPVPSYNGQPPEKESDFYSRVSERLRHKGRAISSWDYERLILERFEEVKAVKCTNLGMDSMPMPGKVKIIVLPTSWTTGYYSFFNKDILSRMEKYLYKLTSASVNLEVINPKVEYLIVRGIIEFMPGEEGGYYDKKINEDVNAFLSPVYSLKDSNEGIGGVVVPNSVVGFLEDQPYVKSVKKMAIEHIIQKGANSFSLGIFNGGQEITPSTPWSVLVPYEEHHIENSKRLQEHVDITNPGIGALEIGSDFILGEPYHELASVDIDPDRKKSPDKEIKPENAIMVVKSKRTKK